MAVVLKQPARFDDQVHIDISIRADLNVSAYVARRQVAGYLIDNVSDYLGGETPDLVIETVSGCYGECPLSSTSPREAKSVRSAR